mmetsp:Transcript_57341/g.162796  ORF Transcript_57341/g.162796 Transcript_57341/m.162796 type:complete len:241 (-) Transcript_57341:732-1454(-)
MSPLSKAKRPASGATTVVAEEGSHALLPEIPWPECPLERHNLRVGEDQVGPPALWPPQVHALKIDDHQRTPRDKMSEVGECLCSLRFWRLQVQVTLVGVVLEKKPGQVALGAEEGRRWLWSSRLGLAYLVGVTLHKDDLRNIAPVNAHLVSNVEVETTCKEPGNSTATGVGLNYVPRVVKVILELRELGHHPRVSPGQLHCHPVTVFIIVLPCLPAPPNRVVFEAVDQTHASSGVWSQPH